MSPPIVNLGDEVEVTGPDRYGNDTEKKTLTICMLWLDEGKTFYSDRYSPWYPASSLRLAPQFTIGNLVEVVRASNYDSRHLVGEKFTIDDIEGDRYTAVGYPWIRADCLRLVEELKIGDFAEVTLPDNPFTGKIGQISSIGKRTVALYDMGIWSKEHLRKLTPEEIKQHTNPGKQYPITPTKDFDELTLRDVARMAGICKNEYGVWISTLLKRAHETEDRLSAIEKRLDFVEKFQRDQTRDALCKGWSAGP